MAQPFTLLINFGPRNEKFDRLVFINFTALVNKHTNNKEHVKSEIENTA